jgi:hypothetical protein
MLTFREFYQICEGKKPNTPPHAVAGTFVRHSDGSSSYTLAPYEGPSGKPTKKEVKKQVLDRSGGKQVEKYAKRRDKQVKEDIETRRTAAKQQRSDQIATQKQSVSDYHTSQQKQKQRASEREQIKQEIKKELQAEQHPVMEPNEYSKQVARQSARWKGMQIRQAHGEMEHQAGAELAAKKARLKSIMSR